MKRNLYASYVKGHLVIMLWNLQRWKTTFKEFTLDDKKHPFYFCTALKDKYKNQSNIMSLMKAPDQAINERGLKAPYNFLSEKEKKH